MSLLSTDITKVAPHPMEEALSLMLANVNIFTLSPLNDLYDMRAINLRDIEKVILK